QLFFRLDESDEIGRQLTAREIAWIDPVQSGPSRGARRRQSVFLETSERLLNPREGCGKNSRQLARMALVEELERQQHERAREAPERTGSAYDHHQWSYEH